MGDHVVRMRPVEMAEVLARGKSARGMRDGDGEAAVRLLRRLAAKGSGIFACKDGYP